MDPIGPELEEIRSLAQRSQGLLAELREKAAQQVAKRQQTSSRLGEEATQLIEQVAASIAGELASEIATKHNEQQNEAEQKLQAEREAWEQQRTEWEDVRNQIENELSQREQQLAERAAAVASDSDERLAFANDEAVAERERLQQEFAEQIRASEQRIAELEAETESLRTQSGGGQQDDAAQIELLEKFDIALADLQSHRERVSELEEQLAARPEPGAEVESELTNLRQDREELAARVEQLEQQLAAGGGEGESGDQADLRARFEMAVEDVRQLKDRNAELEEQLAAGGGAGGVPGGDTNDWEAQKRRLLAQLEGEGDVEPGERAEERASIAGTIQITDGVVAEKDREIQQLREQLEQGAVASQAADDGAAESMLADDEVIRVERERLANLENEWQEKLRQAELELSLERAKIARSQNELAEQQLELETLRAAVQRASGDQPQGESRQNWLKKLGLGGEES